MASSPTTLPTMREMVFSCFSSLELATGFSTCSPRMADFVQLPFASLGGSEGSICMAARMPLAPAPTLPFSSCATFWLTMATLRLVPTWNRWLTSASRFKRTP